LGVHPALELFLRARAFGGGQPSTNGSYWLLMLTVTRTKGQETQTHHLFQALLPTSGRMVPTDFDGFGLWHAVGNAIGMEFYGPFQRWPVGQTLSGHVRAIPGLDPAALAPGLQCICCPYHVVQLAISQQTLGIRRGCQAPAIAKWFHGAISRKSSGAQEDQYPDVSGITTCCRGSKHVIMFGRTTNILHNYDWIPVSTTKVPSKITLTTCTSLWGFRKWSWNFKFWEMHLS
jgi:hypothetical protein